MKAIECNQYKIRYSSCHKLWQVFADIYSIVAEFKSLRDAIDYCNAA